MMTTMNIAMVPSIDTFHQKYDILGQFKPLLLGAIVLIGMKYEL